jgi:hypothetical protein
MPHRFFPWRSEPALRPFQFCLQFAFYNTVTWQVALGTPLVLFAQQLGASSAQIGVLASLVLLLTPLQVFSTALLSRLGFKRLMLAGWGLRSLLLLIPVAVALVAWVQGPRAWMSNALLGSIFVFCVFRAIGLAANLPWFYSIIPVAVRGRYFANESIMLGSASVLILVISAASFAALPVYGALALQFGAALAGSFLSWLALRKLPDGPRPALSSLRSVLWATPRLLFAPTEFRRYLGISLVYWIVSVPMATFVPYYLKSNALLSPGWVMTLEIIRYFGMMMAAQLIQRKIDVVGARPYLLASLALSLLLAVYWLVRLHGGFQNPFALVAAYVVLGVAGTAWTVGNAKYLPKVSAGEESTLMIAIHGAATALAGGLATVAWGRLLQSPDGTSGISLIRFEALFAVLLVGSAFASYRLAAKPEPDADPGEPLMIVNTVLRPWRAALYLVSLTTPAPATELVPEKPRREH